MTQNSNDKGIPGFILAAFAGVVLWGIGYTALNYVSGGQTFATELRANSGTQVVIPKVLVIPPRNAESIANGQETFSTICSGCHGMEMEGLVGPNLKDATWFNFPDGAAETKIAKLVMRGVPAPEAHTDNGPMPPKGGSDITDEQVWEVVYYISSKNPSVAKDSPADKK